MRYTLFLVLFFSISCAVDDEPSIEFQESDVTPTHQFHYEGECSEKDKNEIEGWINETYASVQKILGPYPYTTHFYLHIEEGNSPITFGHTKRQPHQSVHFYINRGFTKEDYKSSWIGPHEMAHLAHPAIPKNNSWYSEGFATYFSREIMVDMGVLTLHEKDSINVSRFKLHAEKYKSNSPFLTVVDSLIENHEYGAYYWGGAYYFFSVDQYLQKEGKLLSSLVADYQKVRRSYQTVDRIIFALDSIGETTCLKDTYVLFQTQPAHEIMKDYLP